MEAIVQPQKQRQYYIDWLRILLILSVFLFHIGMIFNSWHWHVKNDVTGESQGTLWYIMVFLSTWRMPLLILISGAGTYFALGRRSAWQYLGERFKRLFIPLAVGIFTLVPIQVYIEKSSEYESLLSFYPHMFEGVYPSGNFSWHHLWFIAYLFFIALIISPFIHFFRSGRFDLFVGRLSHWVSKTLGANIFVIPLLFSQLLLRPYFPANTHGFIDDWAAMTYYIICFMTGFVVLSNNKMVESIRKQRYLFLIEAIIAGAAILILPYLSNTDYLRNLIWDMAEPFVAISCGMTAIGFAKQHLNFNNNFRRLANEAIYPFYLLHQPVIVVVGYYIVQWDISVLAKVIVITCLSLLATILIYGFLIRPFNIPRFIFGMKMIPKDRRQAESGWIPKLMPAWIKKSSLLVFLILSVTALSAQPYSQTIRGKITDTDTHITLPGANIILMNSNPLVGTTSDYNGNYSLENIPVGRHNLKCSFLGYEDVFVTEILVGTGHEVVINIALKESVTRLAEVTIVAENDKSMAINQLATVSATQITVESTSRIAAGINDPGRTAQSYAGVSSADDENNELVIRGNSPRGMLWRMEGIEIPNPNHFTSEGSSGGGVSALSTQVLANSDFLTGAFPAEYGNALSGVFDLKLRKGNYEKTECALQLGVMGIQAALEGPLKKGSEASYLFNYRYSTLNLLDKAGINITGGNIAPEWQDVSFKVYVPTKGAGYFSLWGLGATGAAGNKAVRDTAEWIFRSDTYEGMEKHKLGIAGITHNFLFKNNRTYLKTVVAASHNNNISQLDSLSKQFVTADITDQSFVYNTFSVNTTINHKFNVRNVLRLGLSYQDKGYDLIRHDFNFDSKLTEKQIDQNGRTQYIASYIQWQHRLNDRIEINTGLHYTHPAINHEHIFEPRLGLRWKVNAAHTLTFGAGLHSKSEAVSVYLAENLVDDGTSTLPNKDLKLTKAAHFVLGYNWNFARNFRIKTEAYYQHLYDVPVKEGDTTNIMCALNFGGGFTNEKFINAGSGRNYGLELSLEKFFSDNWYALATGSVFESTYTMPDGIERNTRFNSRYIFNIVAGKEFKIGSNKQDIFGMNIRTMWRGGYRAVPVDFEASFEQNKEVRLYELAYETKAPDYFRIDLGFSYSKNNPRWSWVLSLDIQNVTNRANIWDEYYNVEMNEIVKQYMVGLIPVLNFRIEL